MFLYHRLVTARLGGKRPVEGQDFTGLDLLDPDIANGQRLGGAVAAFAARRVSLALGERPDVDEGVERPVDAERVPGAVLLADGETGRDPGVDGQADLAVFGVDQDHLHGARAARGFGRPLRV